MTIKNHAWYSLLIAMAAGWVEAVFDIDVKWGLTSGSYGVLAPISVLWVIYYLNSALMTVAYFLVIKNVRIGGWILLASVALHLAQVAMSGIQAAHPASSSLLIASTFIQGTLVYRFLSRLSTPPKTTTSGNELAPN